MNGKSEYFFRILGDNMAGIATVRCYFLAGYGAFLIHRQSGYLVCGGLLFVLAFILLLPDNEGR